MRLVVVLLLFGLIFFSKVSPVLGSFLTVDENGEVIWNVLSAQDEILTDTDVDDLEINKVAELGNTINDVITVKNTDGKVKVSVGTGDNSREVEIEKEEESLIELEERPMTKKIIIGKDGEKFTIDQKGTTVMTNLPIKINPRTARISLTTSTGESFLLVMPREAVLSVLRSKVATQVIYDKDIELLEDNEGLIYKIPGEKIIPILNLYNYSFQVESFISAQTGEIVKVNAPVWYKIFGFLITENL